jgi:hypothetical protein
LAKIITEYLSLRKKCQNKNFKKLSNLHDRSVEDSRVFCWHPDCDVGLSRDEGHVGDLALEDGVVVQVHRVDLQVPIGCKKKKKKLENTKLKKFFLLLLFS